MRLPLRFVPAILAAAASCATPIPDFGNQVSVTFEVPIEELVVTQGANPGSCTDRYILTGSMTFLVEDSTAGVRVGQGRIVATESFINRVSSTGICPFPLSRAMMNYSFEKVAGSPTAATFDASGNMKNGGFATTIQFSFAGTVQADTAFGKLTITQTGTAGPNTTTSSQVSFDIALQRVRTVVKWDGPYKT